ALAGSGGMLARGAAGTAVTTQEAGGGGGGGGTIHLRVAGAAVCGISDVRGGSGGTTDGISVGPGGGGGGGRVLRQNASGSCAPAAQSGSAGTQIDASSPGGLSYGAQAGSSGVTTTLIGGYARATAPAILTPLTGGRTNDATPTVIGSGAQANRGVAIYVDGVLQLTPVADASGNFSATAAPLADGPHQLQAAVYDDGDLGLPSALTTFTVDTTPPPAPVLDLPVQNTVTGDNTPTLSGSAEPGSIVSAIVDGTTRGTATADGAGNWNFALPTALPDGPHVAQARATDDAGNTSTDSFPRTFTVDTTAPAAPVVTTPANGSTTGNNRPTISGSAEPGSTVSAIVDGTPRGTATADGAGNWSFVLPTALPDGPHVAQARATDGAGNTSTDSAASTFTIDTTAPAAPVVTTPANGSTTGNNRPTVSGSAEPGSIVGTIVDGTPRGTATADGAGNWSFVLPTALPDGPHVVQARATDGAGNTSTDSVASTFTVDTTAPPAPLVASPANGSTTVASQPTVSGTAEPSSSVTVLIDGANAGSTTANGAGTWQLAPAPLLDGAHTVKARAADAVGNVSVDSATNTFQVLSSDRLFADGFD
ncbi:Ig-like domain-containing protein, partial [Tahibacter caeni]|uniref:Ig-like domain-containing protein n=1 Tax=Tahibacter caeni TaxID=1453545 RepID=UPI002148F0C3